MIGLLFCLGVVDENSRKSEFEYKRKRDVSIAVGKIANERCIDIVNLTAPAM